MKSEFWNVPASIFFFKIIKSTKEDSIWLIFFLLNLCKFLIINKVLNNYLALWYSNTYPQYFPRKFRLNTILRVFFKSISLNSIFKILWQGVVSLKMLISKQMSVFIPCIGKKIFPPCNCLCLPLIRICHSSKIHLLAAIY